MIQMPSQEPSPRWRPRFDLYIGLVVALSLFAVLPLAGPDYFLDAHDAQHTLFFLTEFDAALRDGVWYPGWATDQALGYGYPTFVLYPPLAYYTAALLHFLGASKLAAIKGVWMLATLGSGLAMYGYARHVMGRNRGLLAALVYVYMPYHLADIYVRADLAEYAAFVWMPLALWSFHRLLEGVSLRRIGLAAAMLALYVAIFPVRTVRDFFELNTMAWADLGIVVLAVLVWAAIVRALWRYDVFKRLLIPPEN